MKTSLKKTVLSIILAITTFTVAHANDNSSDLSRSTTINDLGKPEYITISQKKNNSTKNIKQYKLAYTDGGELYSKEVSKWNKSKQNWEKSERYIYEYNKNGSLSYQIVQSWNTKTDTWNNDGYMIYDSQEGYVTIK